MPRLYFRIYLAVLGSLAMLALLAGASWRLFGDFDRFGPFPEFYPAAIERLLDPPSADAATQRVTLTKWRDLSGFDLALFDAAGRVVADTSGGAIAPPFAEDRKGRPKWRGPNWAQAIELEDGRWLVAARPLGERAPWRRFAWVGVLAAITLVVGISAYPVVRRLTRRLEDLQHGVAALGAGNLSSRVKVEGRDEVARLAETFNRAADRIEALVASNKSLLANASHELRSPLARLRMGLERVPAGAAADRAELERNIAELDALIEEILLASRLDAQQVDMARREPVDLVALLAEETARAGAELDIGDAGSLPTIDADSRLLRRLVRNLLENARRYGGEVPAEVTLRPSAAGSVTFDVADRGLGVPAAERERIFEPFYRMAGARERDGGVGLGLALVRRIAEQHGGSVACLPRDGGGSIFRVTLPGRG